MVRAMGNSVSASGSGLHRVMGGWAELGGRRSGRVCGRFPALDHGASGQEADSGEAKETEDDGFHGEFGG